MGREKIGIGKLGEKIALEFLVQKGYKILAKNYRTLFGEIDAVTKKENSIVFVEIKTRTTSSLGPPFLSVTKAKQKHIIKNAFAYLKMRGLVDSNWRIDVVSVKLRINKTLYLEKFREAKLNYDYKLEEIEIIENAVEDYGGNR